MEELMALGQEIASRPFWQAALVSPGVIEATYYDAGTGFTSDPIPITTREEWDRWRTVLEQHKAPQERTKELEQRLAEAEQVILDGLDYIVNGAMASRLDYEQCIDQAKAYVAKYRPQQQEPEVLPEQPSCPHDDLRFELPFHRITMPSTSFIVELPNWGVTCEQCGKSIAVDGILTAQGLQAIAEAFGERWRQRLQEQYQEEASTFVRLLKEHKGAKKQKGNSDGE